MKKFYSAFLKIIFVLFFILVYILFSARCYSKKMFNTISDNFLRLHIVANSDSTEDQILKYQIRDQVLEYISPFFEGVSNKNEALNILNNHIDEIQNLCTEIAESKNYTYPVYVQICNTYFPQKRYNKITLPEGYYDALKIEIGESAGQNWWCVMFPTLCIINNNSYNTCTYNYTDLKNSIGTEEYALLTEYDEKREIKFKFKLLELFENL